MRAEEEAALEQALGTIVAVTTGLEDEVAAEAQADQAFIEALRGTPTAAEAPVPTALADSAPARIGQPEDPPGWERIHEGSFLEAVLVTQLSGDFPGSGRGEPGPIAPRREFPPLDLARWALGLARVSRPQSTRRGGLERSSQPTLLLHVRRGRGGRRSRRPHGATADFDLVRMAMANEAGRERWSLSLQFLFLEEIPPDLIVHNPMGSVITYLQGDRAVVTGEP